MEERLRHVRPRAPRARLRARVLEAAGRELAARESLLERAWASRGFWVSAAAVLLAGLLLSDFPGARGPNGSLIPKPSAEAVTLAETLASMVGDGEATQRRFAVQLTGPVSAALPDDSPELTEDIRWYLAENS